MARRIFAGALCSLLAVTGFAQESTLIPKSTEEEQSKEVTSPIPVAYEADMERIMLVPFEPKLYMSDVDGDIAKRSGLAFSQIRDEFRKGLNELIYVEADQSFSVVSMLSNDQDVTADLYYLYKSTGYQYKTLPIEVKEPEGNKVEQVFKKLQTKFEPKPEKDGTSIKEGQIYSVYNHQEKYMSTSVFNPGMFPYMTSKYGTGLYLFINQMDIRLAPGQDQRALELDDYKREIKVHYTVFDYKGKEICGGAAKTYISNLNNDLDRIVKLSLPKIASQVVAQLPKAGLTEGEETLLQDNSKAQESSYEEADGSYQKEED